MNLCVLVLSANLYLLAANPAIDTFSYADTPIARQTWVAGADRGASSDVTMVHDEDQKVLQVVAPFASQPDLARV